MFKSKNLLEKKISICDHIYIHIKTIAVSIRVQKFFWNFIYKVNKSLLWNKEALIGLSGENQTKPVPKNPPTIVEVS